MEITKYTCSQCGGEIAYNIGAQGLKCPYCGFEREFEATPTLRNEQTELPYEEHAQNEVIENAETIEIENVTCENCGADVTLSPTQTNAACDFCGGKIVAKGHVTRAFKPHYILPFAITKDTSKKIFGDWLKRQRFAPSGFAKRARQDKPLNAVYIPYWTFDTNTHTQYEGERGEEYEETHTENGEEVTETRIQWYHTSGTVTKTFDDILVPASNALPKRLATRLDEWRLDNLLPYDEQYTAGLAAEVYTLPLEEGYVDAKKEMDEAIEDAVKSDIGGDDQRINSLDTVYNNVTFKHILLPVWILYYCFKEKVYCVLINGETGEIEGERPWSVLKIALLVIFIIGVIVGGYFLYTKFAGTP